MPPRHLAQVTGAEVRKKRKPMAEAFSGVSSGSLEGGIVSHLVWENSRRMITLLDSLLVDDSSMTLLKDMRFLKG